MESTERSIFKVETDDPSKRNFGTCFAIARHNTTTFLLTAAHVVEAVGEHHMRVRNYAVRLEVDGWKKGIDLAVLAVDGLREVPLLENWVEGSEGQVIEVRGWSRINPDRSEIHKRHRSEIERRRLDGKLGQRVTRDSPDFEGEVRVWDLEMETDALSKLKSGYSGSPVCDSQGRVLAVVTERYTGGALGHAFCLGNLWELDLSGVPRLPELRRYDEALHPADSSSLLRITPAEFFAYNQSPYQMGDAFLDRKEQLGKLARLVANPEVKVIEIIGDEGVGKSALTIKFTGDLEYGRWPAGTDSRPIGAIVYLNPSEPPGINLQRLFVACAEFVRNDPTALSELWKDTNGLDYSAKIDRSLNILGRDEMFLVVIESAEHLLDENESLRDVRFDHFLQQCIKGPNSVKLILSTRRGIIKRPPRGPIRNRKIRLNEGLPLEDAIQLLRAGDPDDEVGMRSADQGFLSEIAGFFECNPRRLEEFSKLMSCWIQSEGVDSSLANAKDFVRSRKLGKRSSLQAISRCLAEDTVKVLDTLSVFRKPVPTEALEFCFHQLGREAHIKDILGSLSYGNFISRQQFGRPDNDPYYSLHDGSREYFYERLSSAPRELRLLEEAVANWYQKQGLLAAGIPKDKIGCSARFSSADFASFAKNGVTWEDVRLFLTEFAHLLNAGNFERASHLLTAINPTILKSGYLNQIIDRREKLRDLLGQRNPLLVSENLALLGEAYLRFGELSNGLDCLEKARSAFEQAPDNDILVRRSMSRETKCPSDHKRLAPTQFTRPAPGEQSMVDNAIAHSELYGFMLTRLGEIQFHLGRFPDSENSLRHAQAVFEVVGANRVNPTLYAECLDWNGVYYRSAGELELGLEYQKKAKNVAKNSGNCSILAHIIANIGAVYLKKMRYRWVPVFWEKSLQLALEAKDWPWICHYLIDVGYINMLLAAARLDTSKGRAKLKAARKRLEKGLAIAQMYFLQETICRAKLNLGNLHFLQDRLDDAEACYREGLEVAKETKNVKVSWRLEHNIGNVYRKRAAQPGQDELLEYVLEMYEDAASTLHGAMEAYDNSDAKRGFLDQRMDGIKSLVWLLHVLKKDTEAQAYAETWGFNLGVQFLDARKADRDVTEEENGNLNFISLPDPIDEGSELDEGAHSLRRSYYLLTE